YQNSFETHFYLNQNLSTAAATATSRDFQYLTIIKNQIIIN
ncbi:unnamed protein product, partial [Heterotrigona itama]